MSRSIKKGPFVCFVNKNGYWFCLFYESETLWRKGGVGYSLVVDGIRC